MNLTLFGTGYVGLVTGVCLAELGNDVLCIDTDAEKIATLQRAEIPIYEPGLQELIVGNVRAGRLAFSTDMARGVAHGDVQFIAVGTPSADDGSADLSHVFEVAGAIATHMTSFKVIVNKSTVPVGAGEAVHRPWLLCLPSAGPVPIQHLALRWSRTRSSSKRAVRSTTSCGLTGSSLDWVSRLKSSALVISCVRCTARSGMAMIALSAWTAAAQSSQSTPPTPCSPRASVS